MRAPELAYRWVRYSELDMAATVTIATGLQAPDLLRAFGADPDRPESARGIDDDQMERGSHDPWLMVAPDGDAVIAVEPNGWHGTDAAVLAAASRAGRAAGVYWNVNGFRQLSFAERGRVVAAFEFPGDDVTDPAVRAALAGLDWDDSGDLTAKGLVAVERYTGHALTDALLSWMIEADVGYRVHP